VGELGYIIKLEVLKMGEFVIRVLAVEDEKEKEAAAPAGLGALCIQLILLSHRAPRTTRLIIKPDSSV
jgi:hypothetical protein